MNLCPCGFPTAAHVHDGQGRMVTMLPNRTASDVILLDAPVAGPLTRAESDFMAIAAENGPGFTFVTNRLVNLRRAEGTPIV